MVTTLFLVDHVKRHELRLRWWHWVATALGLAYSLAVVDIFRSFVAEGALRGAIVVGMLTGLVAVVWGVLLWRFVFGSYTPKPQATREVAQ